MYEIFAGRDASRSLATMAMSVSDEYDALQDLTQSEREKLTHWEKQFNGKHVHVVKNVIGTAFFLPNMFYVRHD